MTVSTGRRPTAWGASSMQTPRSRARSTTSSRLRATCSNGLRLRPWAISVRHYAFTSPLCRPPFPPLHLASSTHHGVGRRARDYERHHRQPEQTRPRHDRIHLHATTRGCTHAQAVGQVESILPMLLGNKCVIFHPLCSLWRSCFGQSTLSGPHCGVPVFTHVSHIALKCYSDRTILEDERFDLFCGA